MILPENPFLINKAEGFNHSYDRLASLMEFKSGVADVLLGNTNVFIEGSRGSGKSMYLKLLSLPFKERYEELARNGVVDELPAHEPYLGVYLKLTPTLFGAHEFEESSRFRELFQEFFNLYCIDHMLSTLAPKVGGQAGEKMAQALSKLMPAASGVRDYQSAIRQVRDAWRKTRQAMNEPPYRPSEQSQPDLLWEVAGLLTDATEFADQRTYLLVDEYDSLSEFQQTILNTYLRKRDFPLTLKIACKKHRLVLDVPDGRPLNPSADFDRVELDDESFGQASTFRRYLEAIANKRLRSVGLDVDIRQFLGENAPKRKAKVERRYAGFNQLALLSSGIVRTFIELCRDIYTRAQEGSTSLFFPVGVAIQDEVVKKHASDRWVGLSRDRSARPELQHLIHQVAALFEAKSKQSKEKQIIRLEIVDYDQMSSFLRNLLDQALEYEALLQPNRERLQKNRQLPSRGYLLHRLLCIHFRLEPTSRWDAEISSEQLQRLVLGDDETLRDVSKRPTRVERTVMGPHTSGLFQPLGCPILDQPCPVRAAVGGVGFLSCRLPPHGRIRDASRLLIEAFKGEGDGIDGYELRTAEAYSPAGDIACKVCHAFAEAEFVVCEMSRLSPSVTMELGLAIARRLPTFILFNTEESPDVPDPFASLEYIRYSITPTDTKRVVAERIVPFLADGGSKAIIRLGPSASDQQGEGEGTFVALPDTDYHRETVLPAVRRTLEEAGLGPLQLESEGLALKDLQRAAVGIARARYCLIDTTLGAPTRALYLGMAQGYRKKFANLIDIEKDPEGSLFTNARSAAELRYGDVPQLIDGLREFFGRFGVTLK